MGFIFLNLSFTLFHSLTQQVKNVLLNDSVLEGKVVSSFFSADLVEYFFEV